LVLAELVNAFNCRSDYLSAFKAGLFKNRFLVISLVLSLVMMVMVIEWEPLSFLFHTTPLRWQDWLLAVILSLLILPVVEAAKWWLRRRPAQRARKRLIRV
ncbi:MAG: cation-translocating P-type ATPase C-terminal domain-containing protein, partial [Deltaproteobacteria bacterium]|nr:cation-translocating P-type ATPase C-terminal domain-containing protein [Deltaproteobacteria bacterium]